MKSKPQRTVPADDYCPADNFLLIKPEHEEEQTESGIIIPEQARRMLNEGEILKVGPNVSDIYKPGMFVTFSPASEYKLELEKGVIILAVAEPNIMLYRQPLKSLFPQSSFETFECSKCGKSKNRKIGNTDTLCFDCL